MLDDLYNYAVKNSLVVKPGYKAKRVKGYISLSKTGEFIGIEPAVASEEMCPDMGSAANGTLKSNVMAEKAEIILLIDPKKKIKYEYFKNALREAAEYDSDLDLCADAIENFSEKISEELKPNKLKPSDILSFKVDGRSILGRTSYEEWWQSFRSEQTGKSKKDSGSEVDERCMITGELCLGVDTVPKVSGLSGVGGHTSGDALICFDKAAFRSYNLDQAHNAAVSENAIVTVNAALKELISKAPTLGGAKVLHWYKEPIDDKDDIFEDFGIGPAFGSDRTDELKTTAEVIDLINSVLKGKDPAALSNRYYILLLSGAGGRIMIRGYMQGSCEELYKAFKAWFSDLSLKSSDGSDKTVKLTAVYAKMLSRQKNDRRMFERISKELSGVSPRILYAIINNTALPDMMAVRALQNIRSQMTDRDEKSTNMNVPDKTCCRILKAWLIRKYGKEKTGIMSELNTNSPSKAYQVGRMMAVFAAVQNEALGKVNAGVTERYYNSACTSPALVIGKLSSLSQYHLSKIQNEAYKVRYKKMLQEIAQKIGDSIPTTLTLEEQSQFALGYYQQCAKLFEKSEKTGQALQNDELSLDTGSGYDDESDDEYIEKF